MMWPFKRKRARGKLAQDPDRVWATDETDPLDPHGDGTLRPGDDLFDAMMRGEAVMGTRRPDGGFDMRSRRVDS